MIIIISSIAINFSAKLVGTLESLSNQVQTIPKTDLTQISSQLDRLTRQIAAIPTSAAPKQDLSNLATERKLADLERQLQTKETTMLGLMVMMPILLMIFIGFGVNTTKDNMLQQIQAMKDDIPQSIDRYRQEQAELLKEEKKLNDSEEAVVIVKVNKPEEKRSSDMGLSM